MVSSTNLARFVSLGVLLIASLAPSLAASLATPLAIPPDKLGADLQQTFISAPTEIATKTANSFIAYRKTFNVGAAPKSATLHVFADARYILWLNGQPVHRGPNRFDPHGPEYDSVDVTATLRPGANTFAIVVMGNASNSRMMRHAPGLTLRLDADNRTVLRTDETWKWSDQTRYQPASIDWANIIDRIDSRAEDGDWTLPDYNDRAWKPAVKIGGDAWGPLVARRIAPLRDTSVEFKLADGATFPVTLTAGQQLKFSIGHLVQAYTMLAFEADKDTSLVLNYAAIDYAAKAGRQTYISSDSCAFDGGAITVKSGKVKILGLKLVERLYPFDLVGRFNSSDPLLNKLWSVCARSLQILSEDAYVDCADRERAEWMDCDPPDFDVTRTAMSAPGPDGKPLYADARLLGEMVRRTALTQQKGGWVKAHTTSDRFDIHAKMEDRACDWVQGARRYYESTGDLKLIREIWPVIVGQMDYFLERRTPRGLVLAREWVVWGNPIGYVTCEGTGLNAFVYKALVDAAYLGSIIGDTKDAPRLKKEAAALYGAINTVLWDEKDGTYYSGYYSAAEGAQNIKLKVENNLIEPTLFPALWALDQELVPADRLARVTDYLLAHRNQANRIMMFYYLNKQLYAADNDALDREVLATFRTKWKPQANSVWGTTWEEFNGASKAHCYGMFPGYFLSAYVLGVRPDGPAINKHFLINPRLGDLTSAEGTVVTEFGPVPVSWKRSDTQLEFEFQVPAGITASLQLPALAGRAKLILDNQPVPSAPSDQKNLVVPVTAGLHRGTLAFPSGSFNSAVLPMGKDFHDDFTKANPAWAPASGAWAAQSGMYRQNDASVLAVSGIQDLSWSDATYAFSIALDSTGDASNWAGFQFRKPTPGGSHDQGGYLLYLRGNGSLELFSGRVLQAVQTGVNTLKPVRLKVVTQGDHLQVYLNDEPRPRIDVQDSVYSEGYIGFTSQYMKASFGPLSVTIQPAK